MGLWAFASSCRVSSAPAPRGSPCWVWEGLLHCCAWVGCRLPCGAIAKRSLPHFDPLVTPALLPSCWPLDEGENHVLGWHPHPSSLATLQASLMAISGKWASIVIPWEM